MQWLMKMSVCVQLLIHPHVHEVHATVHENGPKHTPNIIFNQMQLIESVENAYFESHFFNSPFLNSSH